MTAPAPLAATTVTAAQAGTGVLNGIALTVRVITGQAVSPIGTTVQAGTGTTPQQSITPAATGSWVYGATAVSPAGGSVTFTPNGSTTYSQNVAPASNFSYGACRSTGTTTASSAVTIGATAPTATAGQVGVALAEIKSGTGLAEDASQPAPVNTTTATSIASGSFNPPAGSLLVAMVTSSASGNSGQATTLSVSDSGGLTWTKNAVATVNAGGTGTFEIAAVFTATVPAAAAGLLPQQLVHRSPRITPSSNVPASYAR